MTNNDREIKNIEREKELNLAFLEIVKISISLRKLLMQSTQQNRKGILDASMHLIYGVFREATSGEKAFTDYDPRFDDGLMRNVKSEIKRHGRWGRE